MNQVYYDYIRQIHEQQYSISINQRDLKKDSQENPTLRKRSLLFLSDALLSLGQRIRPAEFQVQIQNGQAQEGRLEIKTEGCR